MDANSDTQQNTPTKWFAIKCRSEYKASKILQQHCNEIFFPLKTIKTPEGNIRKKAIIPRVVFICTTEDNALSLETQARERPGSLPPFWIYRLPDSRQIQQIPQSSIDLLRLLTSSDTTGCQIFNKTDFKANQRVKVTGGPFKGYEGYVQRVKKNKHVIVKIEGICLVMLPFIHPDLLTPLD